MSTWTYKSGQLSGPTLANGREHDKKSPWFAQTLQTGALRIADLGFFDLDQMAADAQAGGFWITCHKHDVTLMHDGQVLALLGKTHQIPCRLIAFKADVQTAEKRKRKLREYASKNGVTLSQERLQLTHWTLFLTNAPQNLLSPLEVFAIYRLRWQIELLFRLWKTYSFIDESESENHWRVLTALYAKLIGSSFNIGSCWFQFGTSQTKVSCMSRFAFRSLPSCCSSPCRTLRLYRQLFPPSLPYSKLLAAC